MCVCERAWCESVCGVCVCVRACVCVCVSERVCGVSESVCVCV